MFYSIRTKCTLAPQQSMLDSPVQLKPPISQPYNPGKLFYTVSHSPKGYILECGGHLRKLLINLNIHLGTETLV